MLAEALDEATLTMRARALGEVLRAAGEAAAAGGRVAAAAAAWTVLLDGPMGAGKTTFTRALAAGLQVAHPERVCSPTFTLCMVHPGPVTLVHLDLFRMADADDEGMGGAAGFDALALEEIAAEEDLSGPRVIVVEWAAKWSRPPADRLEIRLAPALGGAARRLAATAHGDRSGGLLAAWQRRLAAPFL